MEPKPYLIQFTFTFLDGTTKIFKIHLDPLTMTVIPPHASQPLDWVRLDFEQCPFCTLRVEQRVFCPVALNISHLIEEFKGMKSSEKCRVVCQMPHRISSPPGEIAIQDGLASVLFLNFIASDCPVTSLLKPLARFYVPFMSMQEMIIHTTAIFLLAQYFKHKKNQKAQISFDGFENITQSFQEIYQKIIARIRNTTQYDADTNAIVLLSSATQILSLELADNLNTIEYLFGPWFLDEEKIQDIPD